MDDADPKLGDHLEPVGDSVYGALAASSEVIDADTDTREVRSTRATPMPFGSVTWQRCQQTPSSTFYPIRSGPLRIRQKQQPKWDISFAWALRQPPVA